MLPKKLQFVVKPILGTPKTGTSLLRSLSNYSEQADVYQKTRLFKQTYGSWQAFAQVGDLKTDLGATKVVDYIYNTRPAFWRWIADNVEYNEFLSKLLASDRTDRALFDLLMTFYASGKPIRGEKTPYHIHHVPTLLRWFPNAKIIHMFRDLRAIFISQQRKKLELDKDRISPRHRIFRQSGSAHELYLSVNVIIHWLRIVQLHYQYQQLYPNNYFLCRFEDLVCDPQTHFKKLFDLLEIEFTELMLEDSFQNSSLIPRHQAQGIDALAAGRWREYLHPLTNTWMVLWSKNTCRNLAIKFNTILITPPAIT